MYIPVQGDNEIDIGIFSQNVVFGQAVSEEKIF
jgi:hypothetical protein